MKYTLAVTSCNRHALLRQTLDSFLRAVDVRPHSTVIFEDSDVPQPKWLSESKYSALGRGKWFNNGKRRGQIFTLDCLYDALPPENGYVFHLEDDWDFTKTGTRFIQRSAEILEKYPHIWTVSLRGADCNGHPIVNENGLSIHQPGWRGGWGGCHFNPGLRRLADFDRITSYGRHIGYSQNGCGGELQLSRLHLGLGYRIAALSLEPYIKHLGAQSRAIESIPLPPRILLAIPATHQYDYAHRTYGIDRVTNGRIDAVRDTWFRDVEAFPNVTAKIFYGQCANHKPPDGGVCGICPCEMSDAVELDCKDDYLSLPHKTKAICQYAWNGMYDFLIKPDDDTALYLDRLLRSGFDLVDQMGWKCPCNPPNGRYTCNCYATGMCYTLSRRAIGMVASERVGEDWAEDLWVGKVLRTNGIQYTRHTGWISGKGKHYVDFPLPRNTVAAHSVKPQEMRQWYEQITRAFN